METIIKFIFGCFFTAGIACFWAAVGLWIAAAFHLVPEARERHLWNPLNGTIFRENLTERGQRLRRLAIRFAVGAVVITGVPLVLVAVAAILLGFLRIGV